MLFTYSARANQSAEIIKEAIQTSNAMLYGGFIRDGLALKDFNDIDIFFKGSFFTDPYVPLFVERLRDIGYSMFKYSECPYYAGSTLWLVKYEAIKNGVKLNLDLTQRVKPTTPSELFPFEKGTDVDINNLYLDKNDVIKLWEEYPSTLKNVLDNIRTGFYEAEDTVRQYRINKIESKGFSRKTVAAIFEEDFSLNETKKLEVKCHQCNKDVYVDDAQCWWCEVSSPGISI